MEDYNNIYHLGCWIINFLGEIISRSGSLHNNYVSALRVKYIGCLSEVRVNIIVLHWFANIP